MQISLANRSVKSQLQRARISTSRPAKARLAAAFCTDSNYLPYALHAAKQLRDHHDLPELDILVCIDGAADVPESLATLDLRILRIDTGGLFSGLYLDARRTEAVYSRLLLPDLLRNDYDRILYLDCDLDIRHGPFNELFHIPMRGRPIAAVLDVPQWTDPRRKPSVFVDMGLPNDRYFNSGVMLIDTEAFTEESVLDECLTLGRAHRSTATQHDQPLLNCALHRNWIELSPIWNWQHAVKTVFADTMVPVVITHFIGPNKPWKDPNNRIPPRYKQGLSAFLARHFPGHPQIKPASLAPPLIGFGLREGFRYITRARRLADYFNRFPNQLYAEE